jgi:hypothetical protein
MTTLVHELQATETGDMTRSISRAGVTTQSQSVPRDTRRRAEPVLKLLSLSNIVEAMGSRKIAAAAQTVAQTSRPTRLVLEYQYRLSSKCVTTTIGVLKVYPCERHVGMGQHGQEHIRQDC